MLCGCFSDSTFPFVKMPLKLGNAVESYFTRKSTTNFGPPKKMGGVAWVVSVFGHLWLSLVKCMDQFSGKKDEQKMHALQLAIV